MEFPVNWSTTIQLNSDILIHWYIPLLSSHYTSMSVVAAKTVIYPNADETKGCKYKMTTNKWSLKSLMLHNTILQVLEGNSITAAWDIEPVSLAHSLRKDNIMATCKI